MAKTQRYQKKDQDRKSRPRQNEQSFVEDAWGYGEELDQRSRQIMKLLKSARTELKENGAVSEDLQNILKGLQGSLGLSNELDQVKEFLEGLPFIEKMNQIRREIEQRQKGEALD